MTQRRICVDTPSFTEYLRSFLSVLRPLIQPLEHFDVSKRRTVRSQAREVVSEPYRHQTAFHAHAPDSMEGADLLPWVVEVLHVAYGLQVPRDPEPLPDASDGGALFRVPNTVGDPLLFVGCAQRDRRDDCETRLRTMLLGQRTASVAIVTDGKEHVFLRRRHDSDRCEYIPDLPGRPDGPRQAELFASGDFTNGDSSAAQSNQAFFRAHSAIRDIDGMHSDEALDELCKVIALGLTANANPQEADRVGAEVLLPNGSAPSTQPPHTLLLASDLRSSYRSLLGPSGGKQWGDVFETPIGLSDVCLAKVWETLIRAHILDANSDLKGQAFQRVLDPAIRAGMGQYFTPAPVVDFMVSAVGPQRGERILDPFCGSGHFLRRAIDSVTTATGHNEITAWVRHNVHGIERSSRMVRLARTDMLLHDGLFVNLHHKDALAPFSSLQPLEPESFDVVLTNPPFGSLLGDDALSGLGTFETARTSGRVPVDVLGLERSLQMLRPGGRLGIVLPEGVLTNQRLRHVREWLHRHATVVALVGLPIETFAPFGANVRTSVVFAVKRPAGLREGIESVLMAGSENVGYDASGRPNSGECDLPEIARLVQESFQPYRTN